MDIRNYEYIVSIAEHQSISRAATSLFITQSALTKFLQRTEQQIGLELFIRQGHNFQLTDAGRQFVETGQKIRSLDRELMHSLNQMNLQQKRQIRLSFGIGRCNEIFDQILPRFNKTHPDIDVVTNISTSKESLANLERGETDLALVISAEHLAGLNYLPVGQSHLVAAVPDASPLLNLSKKDDRSIYPIISLRDVCNFQLVLTIPNTRSGNLVRNYLEQFNISAHIKLVVSDTRTLLDAVESNLGTGLILSVPLGRRKLRYLSIEETLDIKDTVSVAWKTDKNLSKAMRDMIKLFQEIKQI